jgi:acetamidase/formamidase
LLSLGDTHATQGNGELAGIALESPMSVALRLELEKDYPLGQLRFVTPGPVVRHLDGSGYYGTYTWSDGDKYVGEIIVKANSGP